MSLDLNKLENKLDEALSNETSQTLTKFLNDKRMTNNKQQTAVELYTEEQLLNTIDAIRDYLKNYPEKFHESMIEKHLMNLAPITTKRTLIIYNTKETTEEEARHLLEILNCDDSTLWDNADHCGVQVIEVPLTYGGGEQ
jgi:methylmalonyl-CoA mutase N-terminal domain/subunit